MRLGFHHDPVYPHHVLDDLPETDLNYGYAAALAHESMLQKDQGLREL